MNKKSPAQRIAEYKEKAVAAKMAGDLGTAADWYYKAARLADFDSASEYARIAFPHIYDPIPNPRKAAASTGPGTICAEIKECRTTKPLMMQEYMHHKIDKLLEE